jgi:autophagy-related protein 2
LSKAQASLLRVTFVLDFGVPQISIEVDGIQIQAKLLEDTGDDVSSRPAQHSDPSQPSPPRRRASPPPIRDNLSDPGSNGDDYVPTVDELANSFIRTEPQEEIRELQEELASQAPYMQDSIASSDDGEDGEDGPAGMGAPLALPAYLRNILNTALDRLSITVNDINIEVEDQSSKDTSDSLKSAQSSPTSLNFHVERIAIDSITAQGLRVDLGSTTATDATKLGKRRMHVQNICARLVSDVENFVSLSRFSQPPSPVMTRSEVSSSQKATGELSASHTSNHSIREESSYSIRDESTHSIREESSHSTHEEPSHSTHEELSHSIHEDPHPSIHEEPSHSIYEEEVESTEPPVEESQPIPIASPPQAPVSPRDEAVSPLPPPSPELPELDLSVHTVDDDRFADANSDDGPDDHLGHGSPSQSHQSLPARDLGESNLLYDDDGFLEYAMQNDMLDFRLEDEPIVEASAGAPNTWEVNDATSSQHTRTSEPASDASASDLPTVSALGRSFRPPSVTDSPSQSRHSERVQGSIDNLVAAHQHPVEDAQSPASSTHSVSQSPPPEEDLSESKFFTHDEAESMYMSAVSAAQGGSIQQGHVPGGWDSSSASSKESTSDTSGPIPEEMISASILAPAIEVEDGCETPRPRSQQSSFSSSHTGRVQTPTPATPAVQKQAKRFLTIDEITVWFPMGLDDGQDESEEDENATEMAAFEFKPSNLGEDSIFAEMPGSFSNYAYSSSHRKKPSLEASTRARAIPKQAQPSNPPKQVKKANVPSISVEVGSVAGHMDLSTGRIMFGMFNRMMQALTGDLRQQEDKASVPEPAANPKEKSTNFELSLKQVAFSWLENIATESIQEGHVPSWQLDLKPMDAILRVNLSKISVNQQNIAIESRSQIHIGKFVLASLDQDIITFQGSRPKSKRMSSTMAEQLNNDVEVDFVRGKDDRITVVTRPVKIMFDIQKLDDALGSFGGFSGMLELSNSFSSASTLQSPAMSPSQPRPRGVHFGNGLPPPAKESVSPAPPANGPKIQVQFGEVSFTLKGKACSVQLQTTSVRIAVRQSNVRLKVSELQLIGPYTEAGQGNPPFIAELKSTTLNFLFAPEETDLTRLISMITPSKDPYENNDDILIETLLRQRRKGSVLRVEFAEVGVRISDLQQMKTFEALGAELAQLSKVAKYLPDDDRPGLLSLVSVKTLDVRVVVNEKLGDLSITLQDSALAHVGVPALLATEVGKAVVRRDDEILVHEVVKMRTSEQLPAIMLRMVGDEMEPVAKAKFYNLCIEYRVTTVMAALGISEDGTVDDIALGIASSVATITGAPSPQTLSRQSSQVNSPSRPTAKPLQLDLLMRNCAVGLNPRKTSSKGLFVLTEAHVAGKQAKNDYSVTVELRKASMHAIDDIARLEDEHQPASPITTTNRQLNELSELGYVSLSSISAAKVYVNIAGDGKEQPQLVDIEFKNELFVIESCADSTQTLIAILNGLQPPSPPSTAEQYRTVVPLQQMMESFTGDALVQNEDTETDDFMSNADLVEDDLPTNLEFVGSIYNSQSLPTEEEMGDSLLGEDDLGALATPPTTRQRGDRALLESFQEKYEITQGEEDFDFSEEYFRDADAEQKGKARKWDSTKNQYHLSNEFKVPDAPLKVRVRDVNVIWNLYDGYDWPRTRSIISQAVDDVEARAEERRRRVREEEDDDDFVEEDFLFNSVWIGVPVKDEKGALARRINHDIDDLASETGSYATSTATRSTGATARPRSTTKSKRRLKLERSKHKKIAFSLMGVAVDLIVFPPDSGETINSINVRVQDLEVFDHVPTSTWKKFVTCAIDPNMRELIRPMINLELVTVKPVTDLAASELVIKVDCRCGWQMICY